MGRDKFCDVVIPARSISRQHARIVREADGYFYIEDLGSLNGTFVNGQRVSRRTRLADHDRIRLYEVLLEFHKGARPTPPPAGSDKAGADKSTANKAAPQRTGRQFGARDVRGDDGPPTQRATTIVGAVDALAQPRLDVGAQAKLRAVLEITRNLGKSLSVDEFLRNILETLFQIFPQAERGYVLTADPTTSRLVPRAVKRGHGAPSDSWTLGPIDQSVAKRVMADGQAILSTDASPPQEASASVLQQPICSMISAPLMGPSHAPLGLIHIDTNDPAHQFSEEDLEVLVSVATVAGAGVVENTPGRTRRPSARLPPVLRSGDGPAGAVAFSAARGPASSRLSVLQLLSGGRRCRRRLFRLCPAGRWAAGDRPGGCFRQGEFPARR